MFFNAMIFMWGGVGLLCVGIAVNLGLSAWIRLKRLEQEGRRPAAHALDEALARRLERIEHIVEATALEVERMSESQRYVTKLLAGQPDATRIAAPRSKERADTPH